MRWLEKFSRAGEVRRLGDGGMVDFVNSRGGAEVRKCVVRFCIVGNSGNGIRENKSLGREWQASRMEASILLQDMEEATGRRGSAGDGIGGREREGGALGRN